MSLLNTITGWFNAPPTAAQMDAQLDPPTGAFKESYGVSIDADEDQWRALTGDDKRDLKPVTQERMQRIASKLWESNLLANSLVELTMAFLIAEGVRLTVKDQSNQRSLDKFWRDPINNMRVKLPQYIREMELYGEQCYPVFAGADDVRIGYLDPLLIDQVVMDPDNPSQPIGVITKRNDKGRYKKYRVVINGAEDVFTSRTQAIRDTDFTDGDCFLFQVGKLASGKRGRSALLAQADWLDAYDEFMFGELERARFMRAFFWDVTLKGATPEQVKQRAREITAPAPGAARVHNDSEEWKAEAPSLQASDSSEHARMFRNHILGGARKPEHWYGGGGDVNRAVGAEMGEPTFKDLALKQGLWKAFLEDMGRYVLRKVNGIEPEFDDEAYNVVAEFPELTAKDTTKWAAALQQVCASVGMAINQGLLTPATAVSLIGTITRRLGVEFDAEKELAEAQKLAAAKREQDVFSGDLGAGTGHPGAGSSSANQAANDAAAAAAAASAATAAASAGNGVREAVADDLARMHEALERADARFDERFNALAETIRASAPNEDVPVKVIEAMQSALASHSANFDRAITAIEGHLKQPVQVTVPKPGKKTITLPDGRTFTLTEES